MDPDRFYKEIIGTLNSSCSSLRSYDIITFCLSFEQFFTTDFMINENAMHVFFILVRIGTCGIFVLVEAYTKMKNLSVLCKILLKRNKQKGKYCHRNN